MPFATVGGRRIYYERHGASGDPTACVHGSFVDHTDWSAVVPRFATALEVVTYDRRGHGQSEPGARSRPVRDDANDLAGVLEAADLFPAHLIAHGYGGAVALRLAVDRPELVRSFAIHEPPFVGLLRGSDDSAAAAELVEQEVADLRAAVAHGASEAAARRLVDRCSLEEGAWDRLPAPLRRQFAARAPLWAEEFGDPEAMDPDPTELHDLLVPTLVTMGDQSPGVLRRVVEALAGVLPHARVQELADCGHVPHVTRPDLYAAVVGAFLLERNVPPT